MKDKHAKICPSFNDFAPSHLQFSLDGVQESKSSGISLDTYSIKFNECRNIYPLHCIKPFNKTSYNEQATASTVIKDLTASNCIIDSAICDNPKRSILRNAKCHSALYACEYCEAKAVSYVCPKITKQVHSNVVNLSSKIETLQDQLIHAEDHEQAIIQQLIFELEEKKVEERKKIKKQHLVWPSHTKTGNLRSLNTIIHISNAIATGRNSDEESEELSIDDKLGIIGTSILLSIPQFNMLKSLPVEYMHAVCLGVVKRLLELTFKLGDRVSMSSRKLSSPSSFDELILNVRVPREFSRRCRKLNLSIMKAQEMRNVILFFFTIVIKCIDDSYPDEQKIWLLLAYMIRATIIPNFEYSHINVADITQCANNFYDLFESSHGKKL